MGGFDAVSPIPFVPLPFDFGSSGSSSPAATPAPASLTSAATQAADPAAADAQMRLDAIDRNRRGLFGTVATSDTGVLQPQSQGGKTLLGE